MAVTFHEIQPSTKPLACDDCGCLVASGERERVAHQAWHDGRVELAENVVDLRQVTERLTA